jgi:hypothetical protein
MSARDDVPKSRRGRGPDGTQKLVYGDIGELTSGDMRFTCRDFPMCVHHPLDVHIDNPQSRSLS